jgi:hypothetical protein
LDSVKGEKQSMVEDFVEQMSKTENDLNLEK